MIIHRHLLTADRVARPDDLYQLLIDAHRDLSVEQSLLLNAKILLLLANHVGDLNVIEEAVAAARRGLEQERPEATPSGTRAI